MNESHKLIELQRPPVIETAVLIRLALPSDSEREIEESLAEMSQLAWTAGADVARTVVQHRHKPCAATLIGAGKVGEVAAICAEVDADVVIFDSDLTPTQGAKLEDLLGVKVVDRTQLILDIFAMHAHTNEGKHQVELAQLQYLLPRLTGRGSIMRQQGGIGVRGPGEQKLEIDRRRIRGRIERLRAELESIRKHHQVRRKRRSDGAVASIALVGYTNAGKSSLLNALAGADVLVEDKLFATLDPRSRRWRLPSRREVVLSDTVGLVRKLPHSLVAAFRATLEEITEADLLLLVADVAHPAVEDQIRAVHDVLAEIEANDKPTITVFNKIDIAEPGQVLRMASGGDACVCVSARTGQNLDMLVEKVEQFVASRRRCVALRIPQSRAGLLALVFKRGRVLSRRFEDNDMLLEVEADPELEGQLADFVVSSDTREDVS